MSYRQLTCATILGAAITFAGCGGPVLLNANNSERHLAHGCQNIDPAQSYPNVHWDLYNTTSMSVLSAAVRDSLLHSNPDGSSQTILGHMPEESTYCLVVTESMNDVTGIVYEEIGDLGFAFQLSNPQTGEFVTKTRDVIRGSENRSFSVRWQETYYAYLQENSEGGTEIRVFRDIWISRPWEGEWSNYIKERSNGYKETAVLIQIHRRLAHKYWAPIPPTLDENPTARPYYSRVAFLRKG